MVRVALCDDYKETREILKGFIRDYFEKKNILFELNLYSSGSAFLNNSKQKYEDILLIDIEMPGLNGVQVKNILQSQKADTKVLFITGHDEMM